VEVPLPGYTTRGKQFGGLLGIRQGRPSGGYMYREERPGGVDPSLQKDALGSPPDRGGSEPQGVAETLYTRYGDWFPLFCGVVVVILGVMSFRRKHPRE